MQWPPYFSHACGPHFLPECLHSSVGASTLLQSDSCQSLHAFKSQAKPICNVLLVLCGSANHLHYFISILRKCKALSVTLSMLALARDGASGF